MITVIFVHLVYILIAAGLFTLFWAILGFAASVLTSIPLPNKKWALYLLIWPFTIPCKAFHCCKCN